jgi:iron complex outermembrane recepter protein
VVTGKELPALQLGPVPAAVRLIGGYATTLGDGIGLNVRPYYRHSRMDFIQHFLIGKPLEENGQESLGVLTALHFGSFDRTSISTGLDLELAESFLKQTQDGPATDGPTEFGRR